MSFQIVPSLGSIATNYESFIFDLWGVVHNGIEPFPDVLDCMQKMRDSGKQILLLSNAPRTNKFVVDFLENIGVGRETYDQILTSGDMTRIVLAEKRFAYLEGTDKKFYQFGAEKDRGLDDNLDYTRVMEVSDADFLICTGLADDMTETPEDYRNILLQAAERKLPMICANPDLTVMRGERMHYCAGALAELYENLGGEVELFGKPYPWAYKMSLEKLNTTDPKSVLAIGDSMRTDIKGATQAGIDCVLVSGGIHAEEWGIVDGSLPTEMQVQQLSEVHGVSPDYVTGHVKW